MQIETQRYLKRVGDSKTWLEDNTAGLSSVPAFAGLMTDLAAQETAIETHAAAFVAKGGGSTQNVVLKAALLDAVRQDISDLVRGAQVIELTQPGFAANFQAPTSKGEESIIGAARVFKAHLDDGDIHDLFVHIGMPDDLKEDLALDIQHFDDYDTQQVSAAQGRIAELTALNDAIAAASRIIDALDAIVYFKFSNDRAKIAAWKQAKRLEKARAHRVARKAAAQSQPTP